MKLIPAILLIYGIPLASMLLTMQFLVPDLAARTERQCATMAWPAEQHQAHVAFCRGEGYAVGSTYATGAYTTH